MYTALLTMVVGLQDGLGMAKDAKAVDLGDGYVRVTTPVYEIEVPKGWTVTAETPWGQREVFMKKEEGKLGVMTAPPSAQTWDQLYETSLYFIMRDKRGEATPYTVTKTKRGNEAMQFAVKDSTGFAGRRYLLVKDPARGLLALSVEIPSREAEAAWAKHFLRMVESARFVEQGTF